MLDKNSPHADPQFFGAECAGDGATASAVLQNKILELTSQLDNLADDVSRARLLVELGRTQLELERKDEAWNNGEQAFRLYAAAEEWAGAVEACDVMFYCERHPESLFALGHGLWLGVTYPVDPNFTVTMLQHVVEETAQDADGAAVAATVAHYIADLRGTDDNRENLLFFTNQMLGQVARRHSQIETQEQFEFWMQRLELDDPTKFLPRLGRIVEVLVQDNWWIDREALRAKLPD